MEREGISIIHPAKFIMIGSGNPQEGELRPQLLDRFGLSVNVGTILDVDVRTQMVLDRIAYDKDPDAFCEAAEEEQQALRGRLDAARERLGTVGGVAGRRCCILGRVAWMVAYAWMAQCIGSAHCIVFCSACACETTSFAQVTVPDDVKLKISEVCSLVNIDGLRGDLVVNRTAKAYVALEGREVVTMEDVERVVGLCLNHRLRKDPLDPIDGGTKVCALRGACEYMSSHAMAQVRLAFQRVTRPQEAVAQKTPAAVEKPAEDAKPDGEKDERKGLKPGQWTGLRF